MLNTEPTGVLGSPQTCHPPHFVYMTNPKSPGIFDDADLIHTYTRAEAIADGLFDGLPARGRIDCSLRGEAFVAKWWREKIARDETLVSSRGLD